MRTLKFLLQKEFKQIFRNKGLLPLLFVVPLIQLLILPLAADYEIKNINIGIVDADNSSYSRNLIEKIQAASYFKLVAKPENYNAAFDFLEEEGCDLLLEIPRDFERKLVRENNGELFMAVNAINAVKATLGSVYLNRIIADYQVELQAQEFPKAKFNLLPWVEISSSNWYNPHLNYRFYMVPGILVLLVTMIGGYMCAMNIVKEKELGTIEQINVSPVKKTPFILGKLIPFWLIGMFVFSLGLFGIAWLVYGIVPLGSIILLYVYLSIYLIAILGFGLLISTYVQTQQQAMSIAFFFMMIFVLMSGLFTSIDSMPHWAYVISRISPVTYFIQVTRMIILKGSGFEDIHYHFIVMLGFAFLLNLWAILNYKKTE